MKETIVKVNKTKNWFFEKVKLTSLQPDSSRKKERRIKSTKLEMKMEKSRQTTQKYKGSQRLLQQLDDNKMDNLEETDKFLEKYNLPKLNWEEIETDLSQAQRSKL